MKNDLFKLDQATSEGWTISGEPLAILSCDPTKNDLTQRSHVFNQIMAGSAYHIRAFEIVRTQDAAAIARAPDVTAGDLVKLTAPVVVAVTTRTTIPAITRQVWNSYGGENRGGAYEEEVEQPERVEEVTTDVTKPTGTVARIVSAAFPPKFCLRFSDDSETCFDEHGEDWFPFTKVETFNVVIEEDVVIVADKETGAVLKGETEIVLIDVAELRDTFDDVPDNLALEMVGYSTKEGARTRPNRRDWLKDQLGEIEPTLARVIAAEMKAAGRPLA